MNEPVSIKRVIGWGAICLAALGVLIVLIVLLVAGLKAFGRSQARADAHNRVAITKIEIQKADEEARITYAQIKATEAERKKRVAEAHGLAEAQDIINGTLTPLYVQHEAILAQERIASSGRNNTVIYVPSGTNGTPVITQAGKPG